MKNKMPFIALAVVAVIGAIGATFAYFTDSVTVANEFKTKPYGTQVTEEFVSPENWLPGDETTKKVVVKNTGQVDVAVRVNYTESWVSSDGTVLNGNQIVNGTSYRAAIINFDNASDWVHSGDYYYYYKKLTPGSSTSSFIKSVTFNPNITDDTVCTTSGNVTTCTSTGKGYDGATYTMTIYIETVQFDAYSTVWNSAPTLSAS